MSSSEVRNLDSRARRAARRLGYRAIKSRVRQINGNNFGGWMLVDASSNVCCHGSRYDLSAEDILTICVPE